MATDPEVLILHASPPAPGSPGWLESDAGVMAEVAAVAAALDSLGLPHRAAGAAGLAEVPALLSAASEPAVFNLVESFAGAPGDADLVPALCRAFGKAVTGSGSSCLAAALDKRQAKALLAVAGLPTPPAVAVEVGERLPRTGLFRGPYIVKPALADASEGITAQSVIARPGAALERAVRRIHKEFGQAALVERYVEGREINVSVLDRGGKPGVLPLAEIDFSAFPKGRPRIVDYEAKWVPESFGYRHTPRVIPAPVSVAQAAALRRLALGAWRALGCRDYARIDFRLDRRGRPLILEVNPNPDLSPDAGFAAALAAAGISFEAFVRAVIESAVRRRPAAGSPPAVARRKRPAAGGIAIRYNESRDRDPVLAFLAATGFFRPDERVIAQEVLDEALAKGPGGHYQSFVAELDGRAAGWVCVGPTPCTVGTFDIYWIGVDPAVQGRGVGKALMRHAEDLIARRGGRMAVVETSGRAIYDSTRRFYLALDYHEAARVTDFYAPGDDKVIYTKRLG
jgi:D-alanine-D-alanine ligase